MTTLRVHFDGKVLVPEEPVDLPQGRSLLVDVHDQETDRVPGSPAALRAAMRQPPHFTEQEIADFNNAIESGKHPARPEGIFDE